MDLKFYKGATRPSEIPTGSLWFNTAKKRIELITSSSASEVYGSNVADVTKTGNTLTITKIDGSTVTITDTDSKVTSVGNHYTPSGGTATTGVIINSITKDTAGHITAIGTASGLDATKIISGTIDIARLPKGALERLFVVDTEAKAMEADIQEGDTVKVTENSNKMYFCVKDPKATGATFATCFTEYTAGSATSVPWSGVTDKPTFATVATSGKYDDLSGKPTIPSVGNGTITINQAGKKIGSFTVNQSGNTTIDLTDSDTTYTSKSAVSGGTDVSLVTTGEKAAWNAKTSNAGTITGITMNGSSKGTSGVVDLGTVLTGGSQTTTSSADGGSNVYTFSDGSTITVKNGSKGSKGDQGEQGEKGDNGVKALQPAKTFTSTYSTVGTTASMKFTDFNRTPEVGDTFINMDGSGNMGTWQITTVTTDTATFKLLTNKNIKGATGAAAGFGTPIASVSDTTGTPSVTITSSGTNTAKVFNFAFSGLKGEKGDPGDSGSSAIIYTVSGLTSNGVYSTMGNKFSTLTTALSVQTPVYIYDNYSEIYYRLFNKGTNYFDFQNTYDLNNYIRLNYNSAHTALNSIDSKTRNVITSLGGKYGDITLGTGLSIDSSNVLSTTAAAAGTDGTSAEWFTGTAVTGTSTSGVTVSVSGSKKGDMYLNTSTSNVYAATAANTWVYKCNIKGATGNNGTSVSITKTSESTASGGTNTVTFSDGKTLSIKNGKNGKDGTFDASAYPVEEWQFTLDDGTTTTKNVVTKA